MVVKDQPDRFDVFGASEGFRGDLWTGPAKSSDLPGQQSYENVQGLDATIFTSNRFSVEKAEMAFKQEVSHRTTMRP